MNSISQHEFPVNCSTGRWTMLSTILASSMAFIDTTALNVILPSLQRDLGANGTDLFWVLNSYLLMLAALIIVGGSLGDKMGRVKIFKLGILIFTIGSALCGLSPSITALIIFRTIQGIGGALMIPGSLSIISAVFDPKEKGKAIGTWSAATTIVTICGPVLGGALADMGLWRMIFYLNVPLGIFSLFVLHFKVPESLEPAASKVDWWGALVLVLSLICLTLGFLEMPEWGYDHWLVISSLLLGGILLFIFLVIEGRIKEPMMPLTLFDNRIFSGVNLLSFFLYAALGAIMLFLSLNLIQIQGYSQLQAGLTFLPFTIMMITMGRKMGSLTDKYGARRFLIMGPLITGTGMLWLSKIGLTTGPEDYWLTYFPGFLVFAFGMSITVVPLTTAVMSSVEQSKSGIASGINNSVTRISGTFINAVFGALAIYLFAGFTMPEINEMGIGNTLRTELQLMAVKLGEARAPTDLNPELQNNINVVFQWGFVKTYRVVAIVSAILAYLSAAVAFIMVKEPKSN